MWKKVSGFDSRVTMWSDEDAKIRVFDLSESILKNTVNKSQP